MPTQAERRDTTVRAIVRAAEGLFAERGFDATTVDDVVARAGVAKGALYHHFRSKEALFAVVLEGVEARLVSGVLAAAERGGDAVDRLQRGCRAFLEACLEPAVRQVLLLDGPAVLGWEAWRALDARYFGALTTGALQAAMAEGTLARRPVEPLAALLLGAVTEAAMSCARAPDPRRSVRRHLEALKAVLDGLRRGTSDG